MIPESLLLKARLAFYGKNCSGCIPTKLNWGEYIWENAATFQMDPDWLVLGPWRLWDWTGRQIVFPLGDLPLGVVMSCWVVVAFTSALGEGCFYHKVQTTLLCSPHPLKLGPGGNLIRTVGLVRSPPVPFNDKGIPVILSELIASMWVVSRACGVDPWGSGHLSHQLPDEIVELSLESELRVVSCIFLLWKPFANLRDFLPFPFSLSLLQCVPVAQL